MTADPLKVATQVGAEAQQKPAIYQRGPDITGMEVATDEPFTIISAASKLSSAQLVTADDAPSGATFTVKAWLGGSSATIATFSSASAHKLVPVNGTVLFSAIPAGATLTVTITKSGTIMLPACMIIVSATPNPPSS